MATNMVRHSGGMDESQCSLDLIMQSVRPECRQEWLKRVLTMATKISRKSYEQAFVRGRQAIEAPHAVSAHYLAYVHVVELRYNNGLVLRIDPKGVPALKDLPHNLLSQPYVIPRGNGLLFGRDGTVAISIPGLVENRGYPSVQFTFLGFTFRPGIALSKHNRRFTSFMPAVSEDALKRMRQTVRGWRIHSRTPATLDDLAKICNRTIQGRWNYYGAFYRTAMLGLFVYLDQRLEQWARRKYRTLSRRKWCSMLWLRRMKEIAPGMFVHWRIARHAVG